MTEEKTKWNRKYQHIKSKPPNRLIDLIPPQKAEALDLAGGLGANAEALHKKGYRVTLIDISDVAIGKIKNPEIKKICMDLDKYIIPQNRFEVILMIKYHNPDLLKQIPKALKSGGYFVFETIKKYPVSKECFFELFKNFKTVHFSEDPYEFVGVKK